MEITTLRLAGKDALAELHARRAAFRRTGEYPFLIGGEEELERVEETASLNEQTFDDIVAASMRVNVDDWLRQRRADAGEHPFPCDALSGEWPGGIVEKGSISLHLDVLTREVKEEVLLGLVKISDPWQLPAVLKYGAWNECPEAEVHCALHRRWQSVFGAEIVGMSGDVVECIVRNPPRDREAAKRLAWEQYWYCADIVVQGCGSVTNLAAILLDSDYWYFWWD